MDDSVLYVQGIPFQLDEEIGFGAHSTVFAAHDLHNGQPVAIKVFNFLRRSSPLNPIGDYRRQLFWKELQLLLYLQPLNPYVIRVLHHDYTDRYGIIVMELGQTFRYTLTDFLRAETPMSPELIRSFWSQMVEAIYYLHLNGIVHADCKPENFIQVGEDGLQLRLIDLGISLSLPPDVTSGLKTMAGTPDYVAPEMVASRLGHTGLSRCGYAADIWALGVILFEMAFGYRPLENVGRKLTKINFLGRLRRDIPIPDHPDPLLRHVLKQCLRSNPYRRPTIDQLLNHPYLTQQY